jgi:hypothetical protein
MAGPDTPTAATGRHPLVERILDPAAPEALRLSAARGALPIPLQDLVMVQVRLLQDALPQVSGAARASLAQVPEETLGSILADERCDPAVLDHFARGGRLQGAALEAIISHPAIPDATLEALAAEAPAATLNLIVTNEVRIIRNPRLLEILRANENLSGDNRRRLVELERDFVGKEEFLIRRPAGAPAAAPVPAVPEAPPEAEAPAEEGTAPEPMTPEEEAQFEESLRRTPAFQKIMSLNVAERVQLAMKGNAEERAILVRDTAKMVAQQVLKSPKLSDQEIASFAGMRNIHEEILREIAGRRDWTKTYQVAHALVRNPKTPPGVSVQFLPRLGTRDLKIIMGDKNVAELVRRQARNLFLARTQPPKKMLGKKH